ncbi:hypothetical protein [Luteimonas arsenica]|uniref:hypothetical protein n=1 Tax=Luteimonas arsenica TaxID=1586242 RepID=UPI001054DD68|nr:hypothetical protein [Luteimonas arsenica]
MNDDVNARLVQAAVAAGWDADDVEIAAPGGIDARGCRFFTALHRTRMDAPALELAALPDGSVVVGGRDDEAAARILAACGTDADAIWWAEVVARFSAAAQGKVVKPRNEADIEAIAGMGGDYAPPSLDRGAGATTLRFFTIQYEPARAARVSATLSDAGTIDVSRVPVGAD